MNTALAPELSTQDFVIPSDIARAAVLPKSYTDERIFLPAYEWLRANMPVGKAMVEGYDPIWLITKYDDIREIERNPELFPNCDNQNPFLLDKASDQFQRSINGGNIRLIDVLVFMDPPEHGKIRGVANAWFMPANVRKFTDAMRVHAKAAVDNLLASDGECDFMKDFALHYPLRVIMSLFGVPPEDEPLMMQLTQEFFGTSDPEMQQEKGVMDPDAAGRLWKQTIDQFYAYFDGITEDRRKNPRDDLATLLATAKVDGELLDRRYINGFYLAIATAGHDTTSATTTGALLGMLRHPDQWDLVKNNPALIPGLVDEAIRYTSPVRHFTRSAREDTVVRGVPIAKNDRLMLLFPSGNRDEEIFTNPNTFDITRKPNRHIGFGYGPHMCIGQHVAKLEMCILWEELLPRIKSIELAGDIKMAHTNWVGGMTRLPVRFVKA